MIMCTVIYILMPGRYTRTTVTVRVISEMLNMIMCTVICDLVSGRYVRTTVIVHVISEMLNMIMCTVIYILMPGRYTRTTVNVHTIYEIRNVRPLSVMCTRTLCVKFETCLCVRLFGGYGPTPTPDSCNSGCGITKAESCMCVCVRGSYHMIVGVDVAYGCRGRWKLFSASRPPRKDKASDAGHHALPAADVRVQPLRVTHPLCVGVRDPRPGTPAAAPDRASARSATRGCARTGSGTCGPPTHG